MAEQPAGPLVDALGVTVDLDPGQQITEAVVIAKVADFDAADPTAILILAKSEGLDLPAGPAPRRHPGRGSQPAVRGRLTAQIERGGERMHPLTRRYGFCSQPEPSTARSPA